jgi:hypothetical protein
MDAKFVQKMVKKCGSMTKAAAELGVHQSTVSRCLARYLCLECDSNREVKKASVSKAEVKKKSLSEFRQLYDKSFIIPHRIKEGLKKLGAGWEYEVDFAKLAGVSLNDLSNYREQFLDFVVLTGKDGRRAWAGTKSFAAQMRQMI